jgi:hypothetical protein
MGLKSALANFFADQECVGVWKKNLDNSINGVYQSEHVGLTDIQYQ